MKTYATLAILVAMLTAAQIARAQACTSPITSWRGDYSITANGQVSCDAGSCTVDEAAAADVNANSGSIGCGLASWSSTDTPTTATLNDKAVDDCGPDGGQTIETIVNTPGENFTSLVLIFPQQKTYQFFPAPFVNWHQEIDSCGGGTITQDGANAFLWPPTMFPLTFPLPDTVQELQGNPPPVQDVTVIEDAMVPYVFSFDLKPVVEDDDSCLVTFGSSIGCQNQSLGEDVAIVGTGFHLHYDGSRSSGAGGNGVANTDALMIGGWTLSVHHAYDPGSDTLFLGDGTQRNGYQLGTPVSFGGNTLITSDDGSEVYVFSPSGPHLQTLRPLTGAVEYQFGYDVAGNLVTVTDGSGNVTTIKRDAAEHATSIVSPFGQTTKLSRDSHGFLSKVTDPLGKSQSFTNTNLGLITSRTDANGNIYNYTYDADGRVIKDADPVGGFIGLTRTDATSGAGQTVGQTTAMGRTTSFQAAFQVPWVQDGTSPFSEQRTNIWPDGLQATATKGQQGNQRTEAYTLPDGTSYSETLGPDPIWGIQVPIASSETLTKGNLTMNVTTSRATTLGTLGNPFTVATQTDTETINGRTYTFSFNGSNRTYVNTSPVGRTQTFGLDALERVASTQWGTLTPTNLVYDSLGRLASATQGTRKTAFSYNSKGFMASVTDPLKQKTSFTYDADGRVSTTTLPDGRTINYAYDANGNLTATTPPGKSQHDLAYTAVDLLESYTPPGVLGTGPTTYAYDLDRNLTAVTRPDDQAINYGYDTAGRLISITTPSATNSYTYDTLTGNPATAGRSSEHITYSYNGPLPTKTTWKGTVAGSVGRGYDNNFWVKSQNVGGGLTISVQRDHDGLVTKAGALTIKRSSSNGLISSTTLGVATDTRTYNSFGELTGYTAAVNGSTIYKVTSTLDADGRVSAKTEILGATTNTYSYSYDLAGRLTAATKNIVTDTYAYDTNSNRLSATTSAGTANGTYDAQDRLLTYGNTSFTYSANGELASQKVGSQKTSYKYDALGNLTSVTLPNGTKIAYVIDAHNRRVGKNVNGVLTTGFLYDANRIVAQLNGSNQLVSQFVYATGSAAPDYMISGGVTYRIFADQLGSPVLVVNTVTGAIAEQIAHDEFGNVLSDSNPGFQPFGFAAGLDDQDTKWLRFGARDYNPSVGRWTAKDPILFTAGDPNLYGYVLGDPVNLTDSTGLQPDCPCDTPKKWILTPREKEGPQVPDLKSQPAPDDDPSPYSKITKSQSESKFTPPTKSLGVGGATAGVGAATANVTVPFPSQGGTKGEVKIEVNVKDKSVTCSGTF
ncbi:MAG: RHS repeat-associated core domain-containing protein [Terriglobales bacterium]